MKRALIFGVAGQAGSYLREYLLMQGYQVTGVTKEDLDFTNLLYGKQLETLLQMEAPDEIYNLAARMYAPDSWKDPLGYMEVNGMAVLRLLEAIKKQLPMTKFFQAGSAEVFAKETTQQSEETEKRPENPYGLSKLFAQEAVRIYREEGLFACTGILFNMESPRRAESFFAQKVVKEVVRIKKEKEETGKWKPMKLGSLTARRDWGWAPEYMTVAWKMLQQKEPEDFVIGTGESFSCEEYVSVALREAGFVPDGEGFEDYVQYEKLAGRGNTMRAVPNKAKEKLGWTAQVRMYDVVRRLVEAEVLRGQSVTVGQS